MASKITNNGGREAITTGNLYKLLLMDALYMKALHIIFVVTWFAGLFYIVRLFIYNTEANSEANVAKEILQKQYSIMIKRLWLGITWPSAILTLLFGTLTLIKGGWYRIVFEPEGTWLLVKLIFVVLLYVYHFSLHYIYKQQAGGIFKYSSQQLRVWNEIATIFLVAIVMLVVVKSSMSLIWGLGGLLIFVLLLMSAIRIYKAYRK